MKSKLLNIAMALLSGFFLYKIISIDNMSRLPQNIDTDMFMDSLPYIYALIGALVIILLTNIIQLLKE